MFATTATYSAVEDELGKLNGFNDSISLVNSHVARSDLVDEDDLAVIVTELELDVPKVKADGLKVVGNDLGDREGLCPKSLKSSEKVRKSSYRTRSGGGLYT